MKINNFCNYNLNQNNNQKVQNAQPNFGNVFKVRFFELGADGRKYQIVNKIDVKFLAERLAFHLRHPNHENNKAQCFQDMFHYVAQHDKDYKANTIIRKVIEDRHPMDMFCYFITGKDVTTIDEFARTTPKSATKNKQIIQKYWDKICNPKCRLEDETDEEIALKVILKRGTNKKTNEPCYYSQQLEFDKEKYMHFPYRINGDPLV